MKVSSQEGIVLSTYHHMQMIQRREQPCMVRTWDFQQRWHHMMNDEVWDKVNDTKWRNNVASGQQGQGRSGARVLNGAKHKRCTEQRQEIAPGSHQKKMKWRRARNALGRPAWPLFKCSSALLSQVRSSLSSLLMFFKFFTQKHQLGPWKIRPPKSTPKISENSPQILVCSTLRYIVLPPARNPQCLCF